MKRIIFSLVTVLLFVQGCLVVRATEYRITFNESFNRGKIMITFQDLRSDNIADSTQMDSEAYQKIAGRQAGDFSELLTMVTEDDPLLDALEMGIYLKKRYLVDQGECLDGRWEGIFEHLQFTEQGEALKVEEKEIVLTMKKDEDTDRIETDGQLSETETHFQISWPKTQHEIYWRLISDESSEQSVSLLKEYRNWLAQK